jgi:hypothetical protein
VLEQRETVECGFDSARAAVEESYADGGLKVGNRLRNDRLRNAELPGPFDHAARLNYCGKYIRALGVTTAKRSPAAPGVPTLAEQGLRACIESS